jgi:Mn2+/Fe2+ NRAMP family transporter
MHVIIEQRFLPLPYITEHFLLHAYNTSSFFRKFECFIYLFLIFILFIYAYNVWVISPPFPRSLAYLPLPLTTQQKLFCSYL